MTSLQIGDTAPNFQSFDEAGNSVSLADYNGKKLVLFLGLFPNHNLMDF